jgi:hypothetical protein
VDGDKVGAGEEHLHRHVLRVLHRLLTAAADPLKTTQTRPNQTKPNPISVERSTSNDILSTSNNTWSAFFIVCSKRRLDIPSKTTTFHSLFLVSRDPVQSLTDQTRPDQTRPDVASSDGPLQTKPKQTLNQAMPYNHRTKPNRKEQNQIDRNTQHQATCTK